MDKGAAEVEKAEVFLSALNEIFRHLGVRRQLQVYDLALDTYKRKRTGPGVKTRH